MKLSRELARLWKRADALLKKLDDLGDPLLVGGIDELDIESEHHLAQKSGEVFRALLSQAAQAAADAEKEEG